MDCFTWIRIGKLRRRIRVDDGYRNDGTSVLDVWKKKKKGQMLLMGAGSIKECVIVGSNICNCREKEKENSIVQCEN